MTAIKVKVKREILSNYQINIADFYNTSIGNVRKLVPSLFDKGKYLLHHENFPRKTKPKKCTCIRILCIRIQQCCIQYNNGKSDKQNQLKTLEQQKGLFEMDIKTKLHVTTNISR